MAYNYKYLFYLSVVGAIAIPGAALGIISSGQILKKLKLTIKGKAKIVLKLLQQIINC